MWSALRKKNRAPKPTFSKLPQHVAIIMDGNGRWAKKRMFPRIAGHKKGVEVAKDTVIHCREIGIPHLTLYAFSEENWARPQDEISGLMDLLDLFIRKETPLMIENGIKLCTLGNTEKLPQKVQKTLGEAKAKTDGGANMTLNLALSYGGREEITQAMRHIANEVAQNRIKAEDISEKMISEYLYTRDLPDPDIIIRTSGEFRVSNFLPWQSVYSEFYITETLWPDFDRDEFNKALEAFRRRERRFGRTSEQVA